MVKYLNLKGVKGVRVNKSGCLNACHLGPSMVIYPEGLWYKNVSLDDVERIADISIIGNGVVTDLVIGEDD